MLCKYLFTSYKLKTRPALGIKSTYVLPFTICCMSYDNGIWDSFFPNHKKYPIKRLHDDTALSHFTRHRGPLVEALSYLIGFFSRSFHTTDEL